nr:unnamed protein product [Callosobruchus analis]
MLHNQQQQLMRLISTSGEGQDVEEESRAVSWQQVKSTKRRKVTRYISESHVVTNNRYSPLTIEGDPTTSQNGTTRNVKKPPPI